MAITSIGKKRGIFLALATVVSLSLSGPAHAVGDTAVADTAVPDGKIAVKVLATNGSGCPPGTVKAIPQPDQTGFKLIYSDFIAVAGGASESTDRRQNCQAAVLVDVPAGWTFAITRAEYRGWAWLASDAVGLQRTNYYWQASSDNNFTERSFTGPLIGPWRSVDQAPVLAYQPCGAQRVLNVNTELRVEEGLSGKQSYLSMRSSEGNADTLFHFNWKKC